MQSKEVDVGRKFEGEVTGFCVDSAERYIIVMVDRRRLFKIDLHTKETVIERDFFQESIARGGVLGCNGDLYLLDQYDKRLSVFTKNLRRCMVLPAKDEPNEDQMWQR